MTAEIIYKGNLRTEAKHLRSGNTMITDAPVDNRGKGESFSPTDMVATALASCILTIMGIKAEDMGEDISGAVASAKKVMASNPRRIAEIEVIVTMPARSYSDRTKKILEKAAHGCPVKRSLHPDMKETLTINWQAPVS